jgi:hypothetical protein
MNVSFKKDKKNATQTMTATHVTARSLTRTVEGVGYRLYTGNFFSSPDIYHELYTKNINCCETIRQNCKGMLRDLDMEALKFEWGDICARVTGNLTAMVWKDK